MKIKQEKQFNWWVILIVIGIAMVVFGLIWQGINCDERFNDCVDNGYSEVYCNAMLN